MIVPPVVSPLFFFNDTAPTEISALSLHDALPIWPCRWRTELRGSARRFVSQVHRGQSGRSKEHTSELQSLAYLVCRLLLEKKKTYRTRVHRRYQHATLCPRATDEQIRVSPTRDDD